MVEPPSSRLIIFCANIAIHSNNTGINIAPKHMSSYISASRRSPYYAKCHSRSFPENVGSQVPRDGLYPTDKKRQRKLCWTRLVTCWLVLSSQQSRHHLLITYYVPDMVLNSSHRFSHLTFVTNSMREPPLSFLFTVEQAQAQRVQTTCFKSNN